MWAFPLDRVAMPRAEYGSRPFHSVEWNWSRIGVRTTCTYLKNTFPNPVVLGFTCYIAKPCRDTSVRLDMQLSS